MSAPDRPTREQVETALRRADRYGGGTPPLTTDVLAAEVRALRAELELFALHPAENLVKRLLEREDECARLRAALVARTPQSDDPADTARVGDQLGQEWVRAQRSVADGGCRVASPRSLMWVCTRSVHPGRQHVATIGGQVVAAWPNSHAPLPAVPDGEWEALPVEHPDKWILEPVDWPDGFAPQRKHRFPLAEDIRALDPNLTLGDGADQSVDLRDIVGVHHDAIDMLIKRNRLLEEALAARLPLLRLPARPQKGDVVEGVGAVIAGRTRRQIDAATGQIRDRIRTALQDRNP